MRPPFFIVSLLATLISGSIYADSDDIEYLNPIIVSSPLQKQLAETVHPVTLLEGDELTLKKASSIGATLRQETGIHSSSFGPGVGQPVIRGQSGPRVRILQNSIGSLDAASLSPDHANSTEALLARRIEVIRGPATLLYGSGAIGGIVNIIDNRVPDRLPENGFNAAFEQRFDTSADLWSSVGRVDGAFDKLAWHADGFYRSSHNQRIAGRAINTAVNDEVNNTHGYIENSDMDSWSVSGGSGWVDDWGSIGFAYNRLENEYGIPPTDEIVRIDLEQNRYDFKANFINPFTGAESLNFRLGVNDYRHVELEDGNIPGTVFNNDAVEGRLELVHDSLAWFDHGQIGFQAQYRDFSAIGEEAYVPFSETHAFGFFAVEDIHFDDWTLELGFRAEHQTVSADGFSEVDHTPVSGTIAALWYVDEQTSASLGLTFAQRAPETQELFANGVHHATRTFDIGDSDLDEETAYNLELNFRGDYSWFDTEINLFHNWVEDYISQNNTDSLFDLDNETFIADCPDESECLTVFRTDQQSARFYGFEAKANIPLWQHQHYLIDLDVFGDYVRGRFDDGDVPRLPPLRYGGQLNFAIQDQLNANLRLTRAGAQNDPGENETRTDDYLLLDAGLHYQTKINGETEVTLFVKGKNLLDEEIRNSTSFLRDFAPEPGRTAEFGIRIGL